MSNIDWSKVITAEMKEAERLDGMRVAAEAEISRIRSMADAAIAPLQDAVDIGEDTDESRAQLVAWKRVRVALSKIPAQPGYPEQIDWPEIPA